MDERDLCMKLLECDAESEVVDILSGAGYWGDKDAWRFFGDLENNWSTIGNQQSSPHAALVEKLVNAVDATLMGLCYENGYDPTSKEAPKSMRAAVSRFFEKETPEDAAHAGLIRNWQPSRRTEVAQLITLVATGTKRNPCFTIADAGEGQMPDEMPDTLLSLSRTNKMRIPFVQGKFNMGGTGVFKFCGKQNLQLVISKRHPKAIKAYNQDAKKWGFTIVRREDPERGRRSSVFTYLAPLGKDEMPGEGGVLRFADDEFPLFPEFSSEGRLPYARMAKWGTIIKLFEYQLPAGGRSNILLSDGLMRRADLLLPDTALPIRFHEARAYGGRVGSFSNTLTGLSVRLEDDKTENLEEGFPTSCPLRANDEQMTATIYAFKKGKAGTYRRDEGIIFTLNGQTHGYLTPDFFRRAKRVGLSYLADSLLVVIDCSRFSGRAREDLFMNSRDRLSKGELRSAIERELEDMLKNHSGLRELKERRRREETEARLADSKPLEDILQNIIRQAPSLANLFLLGKRAANPFKTKQAIAEEKPFDGNRFPTYFKFKGKEYGKDLERQTAANMRSRISFETDAVNDFFSRPMESGTFSLVRVIEDSKSPVSNFTGPNLHNGVATLSVKLPEDAKVGDRITYDAVVTNPFDDGEFRNRFTVEVKEATDSSGGGGSRVSPPGSKDGGRREQPAGILLPKIVEVYEPDWENHQFDKYTALAIKDSGNTADGDNEGGPTQYDFFINMDNAYLKAEMKPSGSDVKLQKGRFTYGMVLVGLGLLQQHVETTRNRDGSDEDVEVNIEQRVALTTRALSPIILPMIDTLGALDPDAFEAVTASGEAV